MTEITPYKALTQATRKGDIKNIENLLSDELIDSLDLSQKEYLLDLCIIFSNVEAFKLLQTYNIKIAYENNYLESAAKRGSLDMVQYLLDSDIVMKRDISATFVSSVSGGNINLIKYLMKRSPNLNGGRGGPLAAAAYCNNLEVVKILINAGANPTSGKSAALELSMRYDYIEVAKYLITKGAKINDFKHMLDHSELNKYKDYLMFEKNYLASKKLKNKLEKSLEVEPANHKRNKI